MLIQQQKQTLINPETGEEVDIEIKQIWGYQPARFYLSNGDPGYPEEYYEIGECEIDPYEDWMEPLIDWESFNKTEMKSYEED